MDVDVCVLLRLAEGGEGEAIKGQKMGIEKDDGAKWRGWQRHAEQDG